MPTRLDTNFARLTDPDQFESMIRDICALEWDDPRAERFGRKGQKQYGVDVYGRPVNSEGRYYAAQCKLRTKGESLTRQEIETEVIEARQFPHALDALLIVTDGPRDTETQLVIDRINEFQVHDGDFKVAVWFWDNITERLAAYPKLIIKYYSDYFSNLTTLPIVERLIDTPLQIISVNQPASNKTMLEEYLRFRGIRILEPNRLTSPLNEVLPDGIVFQYNLPPAGSKTSPVYKFASDVYRYEWQAEMICPVFVVLPLSLVDEFEQSFKALDGDISRIQIFTHDLPLNKIADDIFRSTFDHGYGKRGSLATMDIVARALGARPSSALLDLDWQAKLSINHFPTQREWEDDLVPALKAVVRQVTGLSDRTRVQIASQLPLPAAFALGYFFNIRVARVGVWARRTGVSDFKQQLWLSDGMPAEVTCVPKWFLKRPAISSRSAILELTSYVDIHSAVETFVQESGLVADAWLQLPIASEGKNTTHIGESRAVTYAQQVGQEIRHLNATGITDVHLFARIPSALAVLIGQRLQACGRIYLYWFDDPTYRFAFILKSNMA